MVIEVAKTQDDECGDGTTTAVILAGELLRKAEELIELNIHPTIISRGFRMAAEKTVELLNSLASDLTPKDEQTLINLAVTSMTGKSAGMLREHLGPLAVKSVSAVAEDVEGRLQVDKDNIKMVKKQGGSLSDTQLIEGIILDKERVHPGMPRDISEPKIALVNSARIQKDGS
jgi:chaperonin GroEL (HSP60 family)